MHGMKTALAFATALFGLTTVTSCAEEEPENFGTIRIEISPQGGDLSIFAGTAEIVATVHYESCLRDFYLKRQTAYQKDGIEGAAVFEEWAGRLCTDFSQSVACEVTSIEQSLLEDNNIYTLKVTYKVTDPSQIAYRDLHVGPLPVEDFAGCDGPRARVDLQTSGLNGRNSQGTPLWRIATLPSPSVAIANQGAPLRVDVVATNP